MQNTNTANRTSWLWILLLTLILAISGIAYAPAIPGLAVWDDHELIGGSGIGGGDSLIHCFTKPFLHHYFRPLVSLSFYLEHRLSGSGPIFYHTTNIAFHVITTGLIIGMLLCVFRKRAVALLGGLAFAVQPTQVSTVAWIGGRTDSMTTMWLAGFIWTLVLAVRSAGARRAGFIAASSLLYFLALMTKEQVLCILPLVPFAAFCFRDEASPLTLKRALLFSAPLFAVAATFIGLWIYFFPSPAHPELHSFSNQFKIGGNTILYYALLLMAPSMKWMHMLSIGELERFGMASVFSGFAILGGMFVLFARLWKTSKRSAWFLAFVFMSAFPILNLLPLPSIIVAPYRVGVTGLAVASLMGVCFAWLISPLFAKVLSLIPSRGEVEDKGNTPEPLKLKGLQVFGAMAGACMLLWMTSLTWRGAGVWQNEGTVFSEFSRCDPDSAIARINYSSALIAEHKSKEATQQIEKLLSLIFRSEKWRNRTDAMLALKSDPAIIERIREAEGNSIEPEMWLGNIFAQLGFTRLNSVGRDAAKSAFDTGYAIERDNHNINLGLAQIAYDDQDYKKAVSYLRMAIVTRASHTEMYILLGRTYMQMGKWKEAQAALKDWTELQSWNGKAFVLLAATQSRQGKFDDAKASLEFALKHSICDKSEVEARLADIKVRGAEIL